MPNENRFDDWLRAALAGRPNVFLVRGSGLKENGRPVIDDSRVSKWLKGEQRPSMELAALAARVLGKPESEALLAAGYTYGHSLQTIERFRDEHPGAGVGGAAQDADVEEETLLYRRPDGLSDQEWERVKLESREFIEWQIEKASRER